MDHVAPYPTNNQNNSGFEVDPSLSLKEESMVDPNNASLVKVTLAGLGGCGINLCRPFLTNNGQAQVKYFDTSMTNTRPGEKAYIFAGGSGSGSNRAENARDIQSTMPQLSDSDLGVNDVAIVVFSLSGGSGSTIGPVMIKELAQRKVRVIAIAVSDVGYSVGAKNTLNTLKSLAAVCKNNDLYLPLILLSNDGVDNRAKVDKTATILIQDLLDLLTKNVFEVDRNDRLNWIDPSKVIQTQPGIKLLTLMSDKKLENPNVVIGLESKEIVDSLLILQSADQEIAANHTLPPARLKKTGIYQDSHRAISGRINSDVTPIEAIIDFVERQQNTDRAQKYKTLDRLSSTSDDDLIL